MVVLIGASGTDSNRRDPEVADLQSAGFVHFPTLAVVLIGSTEGLNSAHLISGGGYHTQTPGDPRISGSVAATDPASCTTLTPGEWVSINARLMHFAGLSMSYPSGLNLGG